ncbi:MAG: MoaD/ThiS family protein [Candidatus Micrarchaeia archaeon]
MKVIIDGKPFRKSVRSVKTVAELLEEVGVSRENAVIIIDGKIVTEFDSVGQASRVEIIRVSSGG